MSSTNKTPNLGLCQWEPTDPFLREDMNETLRKIDEAFDRNRLFTVTIAGPTVSIVLDFSELDLNQYAELDMRFSFARTDTMHMRVNGVSDQKYNYYYTGGSQAKNSIDVYSGRYKLLAQNNQLSFKSISGSNYFSMEGSSFIPINSLTLFGSNTSNNFTVGDVISIWGVKK